MNGTLFLLLRLHSDRSRVENTDAKVVVYFELNKYFAFFPLFLLNFVARKQSALVLVKRLQVNIF